ARGRALPQEVLRPEPVELLSKAGQQTGPDFAVKEPEALAVRAHPREECPERPPVPLAAQTFRPDAFRHEARRAKQAADGLRIIEPASTRRGFRGGIPASASASFKRSWAPSGRSDCQVTVPTPPPGRRTRVASISSMPASRRLSG